MGKFQVGDRVEQIENLCSSESRYATLDEKRNDSYWSHTHDGGSSGFHAPESNFKLIERAKPMEWKKGDRVRVVKVLDSNASYLVGDTGTVKDSTRGEATPDVLRGVTVCMALDWYKLERIGVMDKYTELKGRIEGLNNGWDKDANELCGEIKDNKHYMLIPLESGENRRGRIIIFDWVTKGELTEFYFNSQCEKNTAFKKALLWLLDNSDIKKDSKQSEINDLRLQVDELNRKLEQLEAN